MGRVAEFLGFGFGQRASEGQQFLAALEPFSFPVEVGVDGLLEDGGEPFVATLGRQCDEGCAVFGVDFDCSAHTSKKQHAHAFSRSLPR